MRDRILDYEKHHITLAALIGDLSLLINHLQSVDPDWKDQIFSHWFDIEVTYAVALSAEINVDENTEDLATSISNIKEMIFNSLQGAMKYTKLMSIMCNYFNVSLLFYLDDGCIVKGIDEKGIFETDNMLEPDDPSYLKYYAVAIRILEIIAPTNSQISKIASRTYRKGQLVELSELNEPLKIEALDGQLIWQCCSLG